MAVQQISYQNPTLGYLDFLKGLGGSSTTTKGNSNAIGGLEQILQQQLGQLTPQGLSQLIAQIFEQGGRAVPQIATQYAQAAGARTSNNSSVALANKDLQEQLMRKSFDMVLQAQQAAANTAGMLGKIDYTAQTNNTFSPMQLLPFAPSLLKSLGIKNLDQINPFNKLPKLFSNDETSGAFNGSTFSTGTSGMNDASLSFGSDGGSGLFADVGSFSDPGMMGMDFGVGSGIDFDIDLGGMDADFGTGADFGSQDFGLFFADGGLVSKERLASKLKAKRNAKPKGYANGGQVTSGPSFDVTSPSGNSVRGITYNGSSQSLVPMLRAMQSGGASTGDRAHAIPEDRENPMGQVSQDSGPGISVPSVVGTPQENAAAIAGIVGLAVATALGIPSAVPGLAMSAIGIPNSSMSPTGKAISFVMSQLANALGLNDDDASVTPEGHAAAIGIDGANNGGLAGLGVSLGLDVGLDAATSTADSSGVSDGGVSSGGDAGVSDSVGDAADAGIGGGGFKKGGKVDGPGTETSDSIPIRVSDGEFVMNAESTQMFLPMLELMNAVGLQQRGGK